MENQGSQFDGTVAGFIVKRILAYLITVFTAGFGYPWAVCMMLRWKTEHTIIEGRRLKFTGTGGGLFVNWIKWTLLCVVTVLIYSVWLSIKMEQWKAEHTTFAD